MSISTLTVRINQWRCRAYHGLFKGEPKLGGEFEVNLEVTYRTNSKINTLQETISYVDLLQLLREEMARPRPLLEELAQDAVARIKQSYPEVVECSLSIDKLQAPIEAFQGRVGVTHRRSWD